nr:MAG TPA: tail sheath protein [Caudoviricetes sp.]
MAGGTWASQNKVQPGVYINVKSKGNVTANIGDKGIVAIAEPLSWGPTETVQEMLSGDDVKPYIGYDITNPKALFLREMMKGSDVSAGPIKILLYRPKGSGGKKATVTSGALTVTALYEGIRGNDISVIVQEQADQAGIFDVSTVIDGTMVDEQAIKKLDDLKTNTWVTFEGTGTDITETAGATLIGGTDPTISASDYAAFLAAIEPYQFDILVYDGTDNTTMQAIAAFVRRISNTLGQKCQAVMADAHTVNSEWVISVNNGVRLSDGTVLTAQQATWWLGGAEAGASYNQSLTYAQYPDAVEANPKLTDGQITAAIQSGEIVFIDTFGSVKVCTDINTLTSYSVDKGQEFSKNRVMRVLNQFCNDVYKQFSLYYIGKTDNTETGRNLMKGWIVGYLNEIQASNGIQNFVADDVQVRAGSSVDSVLIDVAIQPMDSIEKIYMTVTVSVNTATQ